jgi:hypothetical protein
MLPVRLARGEAIDLLLLLERLERSVTDLDLHFQIDGFVRILMARLFPKIGGDG